MNIKLFRFVFFFAVVLALQLVLPHETDAYVDPNTGGFFFTTVLPFVYGILAAVVIFWKRITNAIKGIFLRKKEEKKLIAHTSWFMAEGSYYGLRAMN